jgi:hypothetical protein
MIGVSILSPELDGKRFEILLELLPALAASMRSAALIPRTARARGVELVIRAVNRYAEIAPAIEAAKASGAAGLNVLARPCSSATGGSSSNARRRSPYRRRLQTSHRLPSSWSG